MEIIILKYIIMGLIGATGGFGILKNLCRVWETWINRKSEEKQLKMTLEHEIKMTKLNERKKRKNPP